MKEKTILITGCSSGIGLATAQQLKNRGYRVFATARKSEDVNKLQTEGFESFCLDLNDSASIHHAIDQILELTGGTLYALFNNAGYAQPGALEDLNRELLKQQFETNVFGLQELTNLVLPIMHKQGYGRIIHMSSVLGLISLPYRGAYNASKYAVEGLADTARLELRKSPIFVSLIEPGPITSEFRDNALKAYKQTIQSLETPNKNDYETFLKHFSSIKNRTKFSSSPDVVVKKVIHALESKHPKIRYYVTIPTYLFATLKRFLPYRVLDFILAKISDQEIKIEKT